jgi:hypothetical protein
MALQNVSIQGFNVGTDVSFTILSNYGDLLTPAIMGYLTDFESSSRTIKLSVNPITTGGVPVHQTIWNGGSGTMAFARTGPNISAVMIELSDAYHDGGLIPQFSISANVRNRDSSVDAYLYTGVQFDDPRHGDFRATKEVDQRFTFRFGRLTGTGPLSAIMSALASA